MKQVRLSARQREFITRFVREYKTFDQWSDEFNVSRATIENWKNRFKAELEAEKLRADNELKEKFDNIRDEAFNVLNEDLKSTNLKVRSQAWKYILDHAGYSGTKKIDINDKTQDTPFTPAEIATIKAYILSDETEKQ